MSDSDLGKRSRKAPERFSEPEQPAKKRAAAPKKAKEPKKKSSPSKRAAGGKKDKKDGPKRPLSTFFLFSADHRDKVKKDNPSAKVGEISKILGEMWNKCPAADKKKYEDKAAKAKAEYEAAK